MLKRLKADLNRLADKKKAVFLQRFFKTGRGEYAEGDVFLGITVPQSRKIATKYKTLPYSDIAKLLKSKFHEERLIALLVLVYNFKKANDKEQEKIYNFYLKNTKYINNWDLVDLSADKIVGVYLENKPKEILTDLARSESLWERRISMIATFHFIKNNKFEYALKIAGLLINDKHDLIQKAVGWMLREIGKRSFETEEKFLMKHYKNMGRTVLRYAIEKFPEETRLLYLRGKV
jgi:3-methyladenine DNA glycosylase AlkD